MVSTGSVQGPRLAIAGGVDVIVLVCWGSSYDPVRVRKWRILFGFNIRRGGGTVDLIMVPAEPIYNNCEGNLMESSLSSEKLLWRH